MIGTGRASPRNPVTFGEFLISEKTASVSVAMSSPIRAAAYAMAWLPRARRRQSRAVAPSGAGSGDELIAEQLCDHPTCLGLLGRIHVGGEQAVELDAAVLVQSFELRQEERVEDLVEQAGLADAVT